MNEDYILNKSFGFSVQITKIYQTLVTEREEYFLSKQLLRAGTSIGAFVEEAVGGNSSINFSDKLDKAYKEARETRYWLKLLSETDYLESDSSESLIDGCNELIRLLNPGRTDSKNEIKQNHHHV